MLQPEAAGGRHRGQRRHVQLTLTQPQPQCQPQPQPPPKPKPNNPTPTPNQVNVVMFKDGELKWFPPAHPLQKVSDIADDDFGPAVDYKVERPQP